MHIQKSLDASPQPLGTGPPTNQLFDYIFSEEDSKDGKFLRVQMHDIASPTNEAMNNNIDVPKV